MSDRYQELARRAGLFLDEVGRQSLQRVDLESATALEQAAEILAVPETAWQAGLKQQIRT